MTSTEHRKKQAEDEETEAREPAERPGTPPIGATQGRSGEEGAEEKAVEADLEALLEDVKRERDEYLDLARRAKADFDNYRKRSSQQIADAAKRGKAELARELFPALDGLERALVSGGGEAEALARGVGLVRDQLSETLARAGVEAYDPVGQRFDPVWHEALQTRSAAGVEPGTVLETLDRGYRLDGQVLRAARVVVSE